MNNEPSLAGNTLSAGELFAQLYGDLCRVARSRLRLHRRTALLDTRSLVHESFLRVVAAHAGDGLERRTLLAYAARVMRSVIVDHARRALAVRRGGDRLEVTLDTAMSAQLAAPERDILRVHEALEVLAKADERLARVVELRYFVGLSEVETGRALGISERSVRRDWDKARLLLALALRN